MSTILRIDVDISGSKGKIRLRRDGVALEPISFDTNAVAELRERMADRLYRDVIANLEDCKLRITDWTTLQNVVRRLDTLGRAFLQVAFGSKGTLQLNRLLARESALAGMADHRSLSRPAPVVETFVNVDPGRPEQLSKLIPFEFFPIFGPPTLPEVRDNASFLRAMSRFLGMFAVVRRSGLWDVDQRRYIEGDTGVPAKLFLNHPLHGSRDEALSFSRMKKANLIDMDEPWPPLHWSTEGVTTDEGRERISSQLMDHFVGFTGARRPMPDQIHHVFCHAENGNTSFLDDNIQVASNSDDDHVPFWCDLTVEHMMAAVNRRIAGGGQLPRTAILFLNACASASLNPATLASLSSVFLQTHRGFIGTEAKVPTLPAAAFSRSFYRALFSGYDLGQSLHQAKWTLARRYSHPLGVLYTLYGKPDIHVDPQVALRAAAMQSSKIMKRPGVERP